MPYRNCDSHQARWITCHGMIVMRWRASLKWWPDGIIEGNATFSFSSSRAQDSFARWPENAFDRPCAVGTSLWHRIISRKRVDTVPIAIRPSGRADFLRHLRFFDHNFTAEGEAPNGKDQLPPLLHPANVAHLSCGLFLHHCDCCRRASGVSGVRLYLHDVLRVPGASVDAGTSLVVECRGAVLPHLACRAGAGMGLSAAAWNRNPAAGALWPGCCSGEPECTKSTSIFQRSRIA